jgi:integrase
MARLIDRLSPKFVQNAKPKPGKRSTRYLDGGGLHLVATLSSDGLVNRSWEFAYELYGRRRWMGLGPAYDVPLMTARQLATALRAQLREKIDPLDARRERERKLLADAAAEVSFKDDAQAYIALHGPTWTPKHRAQWESSFEKYVYPRIADVPVAEIDQATVFNLIEPHWVKHTETMGRVLNRVERILDFAATKGHRRGDNPAAHVLTALPKASKVSPVENFAAVSYQQIGDVMARLQEIDSVASRALRLTILATARAGEVLGCDWREVALGKRIWTIPASRMKAGRAHRVPLSDAAAACFALPFPAESRPGHPSKLIKTVMPDTTQGKVFNISDHSMRRLLARVGISGATVHGFRSSFRQWAAEQTAFSRNVIELALAHKVALDTTEDAYLRDADLLEKRRKLMDLWATFCTKPTPAVAAEGSNVVAIGSAGA